MKNKFLLGATLACITIFSSAAFLTNVIAQTANEIAITEIMKKQWNKPNNPLLVSPVVIIDNYAVAGWSQGHRGGRALLKLHTGHWQVFCGDASLKSVTVLEQSGLSHHEATQLANAVEKSEEIASSDQLSLLDTFRGVVKVDTHHH